MSPGEPQLTTVGPALLRLTNQKPLGRNTATSDFRSPSKSLTGCAGSGLTVTGIDGPDSTKRPLVSPSTFALELILFCCPWLADTSMLWSLGSLKVKFPVQRSVPAALPGGASEIAV